jgi:hypothetical protein
MTRKSLGAPPESKTLPRPYTLNIEYNAGLVGLSSPDSNYLVKNSANYLKRKFRNAHHWVFGCRVDRSIYKVPSTMRGNQTYAYYQSARIMQIQDAIKSKTRIENNTTNALFITLTQRYNIKSVEEIDRTWTNTRHALKKFKMRLRKMGMKNYAMTLEAHENGGCHAHMIAIFGNQIKMHATKGDKYRVNDIEIIYKIKKAWADALGYDMDSAFVDVLACGNSGLVGYITKELKKTASCEKAIRNVEVNKDSPGDKKKILAFYFADRNKMRLLYVSKGIGVQAEPEEGETPTDLITDVIIDNEKKPDTKPKTLFTCLVTRRELLQHMEEREISPYTGEVDRISKEYEVMISIFEERCELSKILSNKEETERVIRERDERKIIKVQTKVYAQEAIYG